ncbi:hypothetical protein SLA2020_496480 [Shorea laevis]
MAYARSLSTRATIIARRCQPSFAYILHDDNRKHQSPVESQSQLRDSGFSQHRFFGSGFYNSTGIGAFFQEGRCSHFSLLPRNGYSSCRYMSTTVGDGSDKVELMSDVVEVLKDTAVDLVASQAPVVNEVAVAAADSYLPIAALQHVVDAVHSFTGFNWWASIVVTTLLIRGATLPLLINQMKSTAKLTLMRPRLEELKQQMGMDPEGMLEGQKEMKKLFKEYGVTPWTPLKGLFIQGPIFISFFLAISNMVEKVPSFKDGGAYWFTDLTTPDSLYIFPILTGLSFLITVECNTQEGMEGNPVAGTMKNVSRVFAVLTVPFTSSFPKAIFCYWLTSNLFSLTYGLVLKVPGVKKALGVPDIPVPPPQTQSQPSFNLFSAIKQAKTATHKPTSLPVESPKVSSQKSTSSSVVNKRLRSLEKQVKGRKKNKKR